MALGLPRRHLVVLGTARNLMVALVGAAGAVVVAFALSPLTPVGEARLAEPSTGSRLRSVGPPFRSAGNGWWWFCSWASGRRCALRGVRLGGEQALDAHRSSIVARVADTGAPPSAVIGVRHALERGRGAASVPVGTALFGSALAVMALCATVVFADSLTHLTATPALYGSDYQLSFSNSNGGPGNPTSWVSRLEHDHSITAIMLAASDEVSINGHDVLAVAGKAVRGPMLLSTVDGRLPTGEDDMTLGVTTLHQVGAHVGSVLGVTMQLPTGGSRTVALSRRRDGVVPQRCRGRWARHRVGLHDGRLHERGVSARTCAESVPTGIRGQSRFHRLGEGDLRPEGSGRQSPATWPRAARTGRSSQPRWSTSGRR